MTSRAGTAPLQMQPPLAVASLPSARGLRWKDGFRGHLNTRQGVARVRLDATGRVRLGMKLEPSPAPAEALALNAALPGNLRVAGPPHRRELLADLSSDRDGFSRELGEFRRGLRRNAACGGKVRRPPRGERGPYESIFDQLREEEDSEDVGGGRLDVVDRDPGWELGPRVRGARVPVRVVPERSGLRLYRIVLKQAALGEAESGPGWRCVTDLALRYNERTRLVRLARCDAGLAVEARLGRALADVERVAETARAIAVVSGEVGTPMRLLIRTKGVARCYADFFDLNNGETRQ